MTTRGLRTRLHRRDVLAGLLAFPVAGHAAPAQHLRIAMELGRPNVGSLRILVPRGSEANVHAVASLFEDLTGVTVILDSVGPRDVGTTLLLDAMQGGETWDLALPATYDMPDLVGAGAILPLEDAGGEDVGAASLYDHGNIFDDVRFGYQTDGDTIVAFYNTSVYDDPELQGRFEDAFGQRFSLPSSWEALDRHLVFVDTATQGRARGLLRRSASSIGTEFWLRLHALGVWPLSADFEPQIDSDEGIAALEAMLRSASHVADEAQGGNALFENWRRFEAGNIFATLSWGGMQKYLNRTDGPVAHQLVHAQAPGSESGGPVSVPFFNWGWSYCIPKGSRQPQIARAFAEFAVSAEPSTAAVRAAGGFFDPFRAEHYDDPVIRKVYGEPFLEVHAASMENAVPDFYVPDRGAFMASLAKWLLRAMDGSVRPAKALRGAGDEWRQIAATGLRKDKLRAWQATRASYPAELSSRLHDPSPDRRLDAKEN